MKIFHVDFFEKKIATIATCYTSELFDNEKLRAIIKTWPSQARRCAAKRLVANMEAGLSRSTAEYQAYRVTRDNLARKDKTDLI